MVFKQIKNQYSQRKLNSPRKSFHYTDLVCENGAITVEKFQAAQYFAFLFTFLGDLKFFNYPFLFK
ncbi:unnamed protein product [Paramecium sonneborni]|uniref:Uncharacterized protein n=1 Tax=Paramecium sonneborni TaxID=65129 RepID=A0A8S1P1I3_9CILI|nr:unnamed protein product [Paramecium sonneborni]